MEISTEKRAQGTSEGEGEAGSQPQRRKAKRAVPFLALAMVANENNVMIINPTRCEKPLGGTAMDTSSRDGE